MKKLTIPKQYQNMPEGWINGVYDFCTTCENPIYKHMEHNINIFKENTMCGACSTGESAVYIDELDK